MSLIGHLAVWIPIEDMPKELHACGVLLFAPGFICPDFNPEGVVEGSRQDSEYAEFEYMAAVWNNDQDCYDTVLVHPTHYMQKIKGPT